jgi:hypothetical protein
VTIDVELRTLVQRAAFRAHEILKHRRTPTAKREPKCDSCSLLETCRPGVSVRSARRYLEAGIRAAIGRDEGGAAN